MTAAHTSTRQLNSGRSLQTPQTLHTALIVAGVVLCFGMLFLYSGLVQSQVKRGETFREAQRAGLYVVSKGSLLRPARLPGATNAALLASVSPR